MVAKAAVLGYRYVRITRIVQFSPKYSHTSYKLSIFGNKSLRSLWKTTLHFLQLKLFLLRFHSQFPPNVYIECLQVLLLRHYLSTMQILSKQLAM